MKEYRLVWADEFERDGPPDARNWTFETGFCRNEELQWFQPENAFCKDGLLVIEGRREHGANPLFDAKSDNWRRNRPFFDYTSASLTTENLHAWMYGRFEVRARISARQGLWPAIWFLGVEGEWPSCGEIDLMEYYQGKLHANACWGTEERFAPNWNSRERPVAAFGDAAWDSKFHVWRMDWDPETIGLYVDGLPLNSIDVTRTVNPADRGPRNPFRQPHYLLLNLAIGGKEDPSATAFPTRYEIDYVRVYEKLPSPRVRSGGKAPTPDHPGATA
ncbi:MAG: glycoside hydrolase family 16 protein [Terrimicrobiaceae bacterium]